MREALDAATVVARSASQDVDEAWNVLRARQTRLQVVRSELVPLPARSTMRRPLQAEERRLVRQVQQAEQRWGQATDSLDQADTARAQAEANYDATRDGLHLLREQLEEPGAPGALRQRYCAGRAAYNEEAALRTRTQGVQAPLSRVGLSGAGPLAAVLVDLEVRGWLKCGPVVEEGQWVRINLTRDADGVRRSATVPYRLSRGIDAAADTVVLPGEPTLGDVSVFLSHYEGLAHSREPFNQWAIRVSVSGAAVPDRDEWRAAREITTALDAFLP